MKLSTLGQAVGKGIDTANRKIVWVSATMILMIFLLVTVDVVGRYFFNHPIKGSNDIGELFLIPIAFLAMGFTQLMKEHVRVTLIYARLRPRGQAIIDAVVFCLGAIVWALICWNMGDRAWAMTTSSYVSSSRSAILEIPHLPFIYVIVVGSLLFSLTLFADTVRAIGKIRRPEIKSS